MQHTGMRAIFALHVWFALVWAESHDVTCPSASGAEEDSRTLIAQGTRLLSTGTPRRGLHPLDSTHRAEEVSFERTSFQHMLMLLDRKRKDMSSTSCGVWNGGIDDTHCDYYGWYSPNWGNLLSEYWEARGAAALAGVSFVGDPIPGETWLSKLPFAHNADSAFKDLNAFNDMCNECTGGMFPHGCFGKWTRIRQMIRDDTQAALQAFSDEAHIPLPAFQENDMLVHVRFEPDHPQISYYANSFFAGLIPESISRIILLSAEPEWAEPILESYMAIFDELCPQCSVEKSSGTQFNDFAAIALAPTVVCSSSTYCLWAAMANRGRAIMSGNDMAQGKMPPIDDWTWIPGHVLNNAERPADMSLEDWVVHVAKWVREN